MNSRLKLSAILALCMAVIVALGCGFFAQGQEASQPILPQTEQENLPASEEVKAEPAAEDTVSAENTADDEVPDTAPENGIVKDVAVPERHFANPAEDPIREEAGDNPAEESSSVPDIVPEEEEDASDGTVAHEVICAESDAEESAGTTEREVVQVVHEDEGPEGFTYYVGVYRADLQCCIPVNFSRELQEYTFAMAQKYGVSYEIMLGLFGIESGWNPTLYNYNGTCYGLGQLNVYYSKDYFAKKGIDMMSAKGNIEASCITVADKLREFDGNLINALMAYNAGSGGARDMLARGITSTYYSNNIIYYAKNLLTQAQWDEMQSK